MPKTSALYPMRSQLSSFTFPHRSEKAPVYDEEKLPLILNDDFEEEEEQTDVQPKTTFQRFLRLFTIFFVLFTLYQVGNNAGMLPPSGGMAMDVRFKWSVQSVPMEARRAGVVPWWKVALVTMKVDLDVVHGKGLQVQHEDWEEKKATWEEGQVSLDEQLEAEKETPAMFLVQ